MTQPPPILAYASPAPVAWRRPAWWVAWVVILAAVGYIGWHRARAPVPAGDDAVSAQFDLVARYGLGIRSLFGESQLPPSARESLQKSLDSLIRKGNTGDEIRAAIIARELLGRDEALRRLVPLAPPHSCSADADARIPQDLFADPPRNVPYYRAHRSDFAQRFGWYADLALTSGLPDSDPERQAALAPATHTAIVLLVFVSIGGILAVIGVGLFILALVLVGTHKIRRRFVPAPPLALHPTALLEALAVFLALYVGLTLALRGLATFVPILSSLGVVTLFIAAPAAIVWPLLRGVPYQSWRTALGLRGNPLREIPLGLAGYVAGIPLFILGVIFTYVLIRLTGANPTHPATEQATHGGPLALVLLFLLACVWAPITEELIFRGSLFCHLRMRHAFIVSATLNGVIFAAIHPQGWVAVPALASLAVVFSAIREWRGSIWAPIAAHALNNGVVLALLVLALG